MCSHISHLQGLVCVTPAVVGASDTSVWVFKHQEPTAKCVGGSSKR